MSSGKPELEQVFEGLPTRVALSYVRCTPASGDTPRGTPPSEVVVIVSFSEKGFGFGEVCLKQTPEGLFLDTERMNLNRVKRYFMHLLDSAVTDNDQSPDNHALYNRVMGRQCGPGCSVCHPGPQESSP